MISGVANNLGKALALGEILQTLAKNEGWLKEQTAHAFADLLLFCSENEIPLREVPVWSTMASWLDLEPRVKILTGDLKVPFERLLDACVAENSSMLELEPNKLKLKWKKVISIPMTQGQLHILFDLVSDIPEDYREALRAAGSLRSEVPETSPHEIISCEVPL